MSGKGQFVCGEKHCPRSDLSFAAAHTALPLAAAATAPPVAAGVSAASASSSAASSSATSSGASASTADAKPERLLRTWEVNFAYVEHGAKKNALIKLRAHLCSVAQLSRFANCTQCAQCKWFLFHVRRPLPRVFLQTQLHTQVRLLYFALSQSFE